MAKIISFKTQKVLGGQDYTENEKLIEDSGRYIGVLPKGDADRLRKFQDKLICEQAELNELIEEFNEHYKEYTRQLIELFLNLGCDPFQFPFDPETEKLYISEDGHMWAVQKEDN